MKKIISSLLCVFMLFLPTVNVIAETNQYELIYEHTASYEMTIPSTGDINPSSGEGTIEFAIENSKLEEGTVIQVSVSSDNCDDGIWYLVNEKNPNSKIAYTISANGNSVGNNERVFSSADGTTMSLDIALTDTTKVGTFSDIITFSSKIVDVIEFELEEYFDIGGIVQAEKDMTWREWVNSPYNTFGYVITKDEVGADAVGIWVESAEYYMWITNEEYETVKPDDVIVEGCYYKNN
jgi:hypothetical protein